VADALAVGDGKPPIGAYELERVLLEHPAVAEAAVVAMPNSSNDASVKAYLTLGPNHSPDDDLRRDVLEFGMQRLGTLAPTEVEFVPALPRTRTGSLLRQDLRTHTASTH
jgi:acetyl-CoA synthetase